jgi:hypothetical protein
MTAILAAAAPSAEAGQFASDSFGLAGTPGPNLPSHANQFFRDGVPSPCEGKSLGGSPSMTPDRRAYQSRSFTNLMNESACVTVTLSTSCTGGDEVMSETYSPAFDPENITSNWVADLGNSPPAQTSYAFTIASGAAFETVVDEVLDTANCGGVNVTWSSDRPWATARPSPQGVPAVGQALHSVLDVWPGDPVVVRRWQRCDGDGMNCTDIPGVTGKDYTLTDEDIGHAIRMDESATEGGFTSTIHGRGATPAVFIPAMIHDGGAWGPGDFATVGHLDSSDVSRCGEQQSAPAKSGSESHFYDVFAITSLINEPACVHVVQTQSASASLCAARLALYSPTFQPADLSSNLVANDPTGVGFAATLAPGASGQAVIFDPGMPSTCVYGLIIGSDAPFATGRPELSGDARAGTPVTTTNGVWSGAPAFAYAWRRCDAGGGNCVPIDGATASTYTPTGADVGSTLRSRLTATRGGRSASSDSQPSGMIEADRTAPKGTVRLASRNLAKAVRSGRVPLYVTCDEACSAVVEVRLTRKLAKALGLGRKKVIAKARGNTTAGRRKTLRAKLTRKARRAMRRRNSLKLRLAATFTDTSGNRSRRAGRGTLKRPRR